MKLISHRGNINGPEPDKENDPSHIEMAISGGYDVEIDVWLINDELFLGHDYPEHKIELQFLSKNGLWCHAKNIEALDFLMSHNMRCFWHQGDDVTLTYPDMFLWTYPNKTLTKRSICVYLDGVPTGVRDCYGVCSDHVAMLRGQK